ncbi:MAG: diaminopimelate epimerase [Syntrophomonadaceae bacterium]|jgi:diaminopimelate epimerase
MKFTKMHGLGNDFVIMEASSWTEASRYQNYASIICDRNFGVGADGLIITGPHNHMDIFMRIFNPDGSEPEMCGNGIRCVARYAYEHGLVQNQNISVLTQAGTIYPEILLNDNQVEAIKVDMGIPILERELIPLKGQGDNIGICLKVPGLDFIITAVSMGNPHCIVFVDNVENFPVHIWGPLLENHEMFPARTNVEFVQIINKNELSMRVWERGAGTTLACGTGACASLVASVLNNKTSRKAIVHLPGGDLYIEWLENDNHVYMTGPATEVFYGNLLLGQA